MGGTVTNGGKTNTVGTASTGGISSVGVGGISGTGGQVAAGGSLATGGTYAAGGTPTTGGTPSTSPDAGSGCTGSYEFVQSNTGLCVANMATIAGPESDAGSTDYGIDITEVTEGQYDEWLATNPALPDSTDANCGWKSTGSYAQYGPGDYTGADADHHPVVNVDWCDAYAYCAGVGKRLCGAIQGGPNDVSSYADSTASQWYRVCSSGGTNAYPYGNAYQSSFCQGTDYGDTSLAVGSLANCVTSATGYAGVYDLSGNVWEWEDSCDGSGESGSCGIRGGSFGNGGWVLACSTDLSNPRYFTDRHDGFRCCSVMPTK